MDEMDIQVESTNKPEDTSNFSETKVDFRETYSQSCKFCEERENKIHDEKLRFPRKHEKEVQTFSAWQEMEDDKALQQENEAWEAGMKTLYQEIATLTRDKEALQEEMDRAHTRENALRDQMQEMETVHSFDEMLLEQQKQELKVLSEKVRMLEELLQWERDLSMEQEEQDLRSEPDRLSLRRGILRIFIPGWRRRYTSADTAVYMEPEEQARLEAQRGPSLWERLVIFCSWSFRRSRNVEGESGSWDGDMGATARSQRNE